ncbi:MAG: reverse transcriptase domain-containing protein [Potamolinea sp.]
MIRKEDLEQRLKDLGWTLYKLAKQFSILRAADGDVSPATRYQTAIGKAMENPRSSKLETIEGIIQALNGKLTIVWEPEQVVTIQLDAQLMEALKQRASADGAAIDEVAKQLFEQALSGIPAHKPSKLTDLIIAEEPKIYRSFHPLIASAYSAVDQWLNQRPEAEGYKKLDYSKDLWLSLDKTDLKSTAFQYYTLFPRYYFESAHTLENIIHSTRFLKGLKYNPRICVVDIGCAMGAASAALIERILTLQKDENISNPIEIVCLGIDPSIYGITLYSKLMQELKQNLSSLNINLEFQPICERVPQAMITAMRYLQKKREVWGQPVLSNLFLMQLDAASSISEDQILKREQYEKLKELGVETDLILETDKEFWQAEVLGYKQLLEEVPIEHLCLLLLGTKNLTKYIQENSQFNQLIDVLPSINQAMKKIIGDSHHGSIVFEGEQQVHFENPLESYWQNQQHSSKFQASIHTISSRKVEADQDWNKLISLENLELAWVRARHNLLNIEACYDEIEIRLFENNLDSNLKFMQQQLMAYCDEVIPVNEAIPYNFVKGTSATRPKQLSRLEEEILSTAIIETIGNKVGLEFSSYRPTKVDDENTTEYLYENWWEGYKKFRDEVREGVKEYPRGAVLRTDIKSYYTNVIQKQLLEITQEKLGFNSERLRWLLEKTLGQDLPGHQAGLGLSQGTITSGFYANLYLSAIDSIFNNDKKWRVKFYRYVDDIIIILPRTSYIDAVEQKLEDELTKLGLELNQDKTEHYDNIGAFLETMVDDAVLQTMGEKFNKIISNLWKMNSTYRLGFEFAHNSETESSWWERIHLYQQCLYSIQIYVTETYLSRKIYQYLFQQNTNRNRELDLPPFASSDNFSLISNWARAFEVLQPTCLKDKNNLKAEIIELFKQSLRELRGIVEKIKNIEPEERPKLLIKRRKLDTRIRFAVNKLTILGFEEIWEEVVELICGEIFVIRDLLEVVTKLARQGYADAIKRLWECYQNNERPTSEYIRAVVLEAIRFLPSIDLENWELIFESATTGQSDIERLKATETWLYLGDVAKSFVQNYHIQAVIKALNSETPPFTRLKKNYILILGMHDPDAISNISISQQDKEDYIIRDALKLALEGKVSELFKEDEPAIVRQYYSVKRATTGDDKPRYSL